MKIDVFDTYARHPEHGLLHFDVLLPEGGTQSEAEASALAWLEEIGIQPSSIRVDHCNYCHSEIAIAEMESTLNMKGYAILQLEGCPAPAC